MEEKIEIIEMEDVEENESGLSVNLTQQQQRFVENIVYHDMSQTEAARKAGYNHPAVQANRNMKNKSVIIGIEELRYEAQHRNHVTLDRSLRDLKSIRDAAFGIIMGWIPLSDEFDNYEYSEPTATFRDNQNSFSQRRGQQ